MLIGIDLGTTNSLAACYRDGKTEIIPNRLGKNMTPSVVSVTAEGDLLVGETAREYGILHPQNMARLFKRTMGTDKTYSLNGQEFSSEELSSFVLRSLKQDAEVYLDCEVDEAIISVPAYFNEKQRRATKRAGELAGLKVSRIINEPTAAAVSCGVAESEESSCCMVLDLGGGTFDVTILEYDQNIMEVYAVAGDNMLGGEDFTLKLMEMFARDNQIDMTETDLKTLGNLYQAAEFCKCGFSERNPSVMAVNIKGMTYESEYTLSEYEEACIPLLERMRKPMEKALKDAKITLDDLDRILLVGGAVRLPMIRSYVQKLTGIFTEFSEDPDLSVVQGAALACAMKERKQEIREVILTDVCPFTLGTAVVSPYDTFADEERFLPIIERNTVIPVSRTQTVYTASDDQQYLRVKVLQGESRLANHNLLIGELTVEVPRGPRGQESAEITYTYDVNSLLEVEVKVISTGLKKKIIIQDEKNKISEEEAQERLERLSYMKQNPREEEKNMYVMLKAERIYEEASKEDRTKIDEAVQSFREAMGKGTRLSVDKQRQELMDLLDEIENKDIHVFRA